MALQALADEFSREAQGGSKYLDENEVLAMLARFKGWLPETESIRVFDAKNKQIALTERDEDIITKNSGAF